MRLLALAFALVALGHLAYLPSELSPINASTLFDAATVALVGWVALVLAQGGELPRVPLVALAAVKGIDFLASLSGGLHTYHWGWAGIALGAILVGWGAYRMQPQLVRAGAAVSAAGAAVYVVLAIVYGPLAFFVGAALVLAGWALVAWRAASAAPETTPRDAAA